MAWERLQIRTNVVADLNADTTLSGQNISFASSRNRDVPRAALPRGYVYTENDRNLKTLKRTYPREEQREVVLLIALFDHRRSEGALEDQLDVVADLIDRVVLQVDPLVPAGSDIETMGVDVARDSKGEAITGGIVLAYRVTYLRQSQP